MGKKLKVSEKRAKKLKSWIKLWNCLDKYEKILIVQCDNVGSKQFQDIRVSLRPLGAEVFMGKKVLNINFQSS
jgi:large subunit ribosomal protein LP0